MHAYYRPRLEELKEQLKLRDETLKLKDKMILDLQDQVKKKTSVSKIRHFTAFD